MQQPAHLLLPWVTCDTGKQAAASLPGCAGTVLDPFRCPGTQQLACSIRHGPIISGAMFSGSLAAQTVNLVLKRASLLCFTGNTGRSEGFLRASECAAVTHLEARVCKDLGQFTSNYCYESLSNHRNKKSYRLIKIYTRYIL